MNKPFYIDWSVLEISKVVMYEFLYDFVKLKYEEKTILCYTNTENFTVYIKTGDIYLHTAKDVEARFDTSNYELERPLPGGKNKKSYYINERWIRRKNNDSLSHWDQRYIAI